MLFATFSWAGMCCLHSQQAHQPNDLNCQFRHMKPTLCNWTDLIKSHQSYLDTSSWTFLSFFVRWQCRWTSSARRNYVLRQVSTTKFGQKVIEPCSCSACHVVVLLPNLIPGYSASGAADILSDLHILVVPMTIDDSSESKEIIRTSIYLLVTVAADQEAFQGPIKGWIPIPIRFPCSSHIIIYYQHTSRKCMRMGVESWRSSSIMTIMNLAMVRWSFSVRHMCATMLVFARTTSPATEFQPSIVRHAVLHYYRIKKKAMLELQLQQGLATFYTSYNIFTVIHLHTVSIFMV